MIFAGFVIIKKDSFSVVTALVGMGCFNGRTVHQCPQINCIHCRNRVANLFKGWQPLS